MAAKSIDLKLGDIKEPFPKRILAKFQKKAFADCNRYPSNYPLLISDLAKKFGVKEEEIVLVNGVDEGIELIARCFGQDTLVFAPSYYEFVDAPRRNGLAHTVRNCFDGKGYRLRYSDEDVRNRSLIYLCNPNNPFGLLSKEEIVTLANKTKAVVAVDETYIDFDGESVMKAAPNILALRSFSKGFAMAGFRVGCVVGAKELIDKLNLRKLYCNVTSVSVEAARIALTEKNYFGGMIAKIKKRKLAFEDYCAKKGLPVIKTNTNNVILKFESKTRADAFFAFLKDNGIIANQGNGVSTCGLDESWIRFACGTKEQMLQVRKILEKW